MKQIDSTIVIILLLLSLIGGCRAKSSDPMFPLPVTTVDLQYNKIQMDTLFLQDSSSSFQGYTSVWNNTIYFADAYFSKTTAFDTNGLLLKKYLGAGSSNKELQVGQSCASNFFADGRNIYMGHNIDCHLYDTNFERIQIFQIKRYLDNFWDDKTNAEIPKNYGFQWEKIILREFDNNLFVNISCRRKKIQLSSVEDPFSYYRQAKILMKINLKNESVEELLGGYPPSYIKNCDTRSQFENISYDIDKKGNFYISYDADPIVYVYDKNFKPMYSFGAIGQDMDTHYLDNYTIKQNEDLWMQDDKGRYEYIEYIDETNLLFRSYIKKKEALTDGLQIFNGNTLVADFDVPKGFRIAGYIAPYYYSHIKADEDAKILKMYRFKLRHLALFRDSAFFGARCLVFSSTEKLEELIERLR